ncbi:MAG TPA: hypothetical protein VGQ24_02780 [Gemmatimonadales bacterium]|jgi:hypothetical protein|nr:hypothetical protein [Gemmatimonadales bacterium]
MSIESQPNPALSDVGQVETGAQAAGGCSNSNSHNAGGGGGQPSQEEMRSILNQLAAVLPRLQRAAESAPPG